MADQPIIVTAATPEALIIRRRYRPIATLVLVSLNVAIFALMELSGGSKMPQVLLNFGACYGPFIRRGEYWRLVMPMFLHIGYVHLILNITGLFVLGRILESVYGYGRFALLYVASGIGSSLLSMTLSPNVSAGASGAIFGIAGAMLTAGYLHRSAIPRHWRRAFGGGILPLIVLNLALGYAIPGIDNWGHLGGLVTGMVLSGLIPPPGLEWTPGYAVEEPSQAAAILPIIVVALAMGATVNHYRESRQVDRLLAESSRLRVAGQPDRALERIREASRLAPHDERPHEELGEYYLRNGQIDQAIQELEEAHRLSPVSARAQRDLARAYRLKGDVAKADQLLAEMLGENAASAEGRRLLGDLYFEDKIYPEAIKHYQEALKLNPNDAVAHNNLAWLYATSEEQQFRDAKGALEHAQKAVELSHWRVAAFIDTLAEANFVNGRFDEAVTTQARALKLEPRNPEYLDHMARYRKAAGV
ncbi:MAG: rhomboid family intramembrane serine protease [Acidobacteriia bacterium]|nr:rhomboid family intramembrane serine protease [Terriglobia bacterium]